MMILRTTFFAEKAGRIADLQERDDLFLATDSQDVHFFWTLFGLECDPPFDTVFYTLPATGTLPEIFCCHGIPYLEKTLYRVYLPEHLLFALTQ